jgi:hypothetical protein
MHEWYTWHMHEWYTWHMHEWYTWHMHEALPKGEPELVFDTYPVSEVSLVEERGGVVVKLLPLEGRLRPRLRLSPGMALVPIADRGYSPARYTPTAAQDTSVAAGERGFTRLGGGELTEHGVELLVDLVDGGGGWQVVGKALSARGGRRGGGHWDLQPSGTPTHARHTVTNISITGVRP